MMNLQSLDGSFNDQRMKQSYQSQKGVYAYVAEKKSNPTDLKSGPVRYPKQITCGPYKLLFLSQLL